MKNYAVVIAQELGLQEKQVSNVLELLDGGATIPFIARYRKEATDSLDEVQIGAIRDRHLKLVELDKRRAAIIDSVAEQGKLTDELRTAFGALPSAFAAAISACCNALRLSIVFCQNLIK